ncbi:uronyl 2-sulfotransferase [Strongylocentrotus purpuratus]|uniref:Uronyl 2-sulfotransferase n=1 Tax=Strongylocentrotus purpuratus TaxID=7668 RepID=A0A7M7N658_STRPU|nr:uronyl 2-sulfotransferase [Strongylocentrotus purpuratus]
MSFSKTKGLFICCIALTICLLYTMMTKDDYDMATRYAPRGTDLTTNRHGDLGQHQDESSTPYQIKLGNTISNALYKLYMANGRPVETSLHITNGQISIAAIDGPNDDDDEEDYDFNDDDDDNEYDDVFMETGEEDDYSWRDVMDDLKYDSEDDDEKVGLWSNTTTDTGAEDPAAAMRGYNDRSASSLEGEKKFRYLWNEWDPAGWMKLPLVSGKQTEMELGSPAIVFNRVGKCGSRVVINVLQELSKSNRFYLVCSLTYNRTRLTPSAEEHLVKVTSSLKRPNIFQRHIHFIDYSRHQMPQPLYINIIRDPLDRMVSQYYYSRFGDERSTGHIKGKYQYQTFDECVLSGSEECLGPKAFYIIPYFCGQDLNCTKDRPWAFQKAVENLNKYYIVTGILEELEDTFRLFERVLPSFFKGALEIYQSLSIGDNLKKNLTTTVTKHKIKPSPEVSRIMKEHMKLEYSFYELVKEKFHDQKRRLGIV